MLVVMTKEVGLADDAQLSYLGVVRFVETKKSPSHDKPPAQSLAEDGVDGFCSMTAGRQRRARSTRRRGCWSEMLKEQVLRREGGRGSML